MSRRPLSIDLLAPGCEVFTALERNQDYNGNAIGGVILEMTDHRDLETGEVTRSYLCLDVARAGGDRLCVSRIPESDLNPETFKGPSRTKLTNARRKLMRWIQRGRDGKRREEKAGAWSPEEEQWAYWFSVLTLAAGAREISP
jgi:hypothetical protein